MKRNDLGFDAAFFKFEQGESFIGFGEEEGAGVKEEQAGAAFEEGDMGMAEEGDRAVVGLGCGDQALEGLGHVVVMAVGEEEAMAQSFEDQVVGAFLEVGVAAHGRERSLELLGQGLGVGVEVAQVEDLVHRSGLAKGLAGQIEAEVSIR